MPAAVVATTADHSAQVRRVWRHPFQSSCATNSEKSGVTAEEKAPPKSASATPTNRPEYASADTLPAGSIAAIDWSTSRPPDATIPLKNTGPYCHATSRVPSHIPCHRSTILYSLAFISDPVHVACNSAPITVPYTIAQIPHLLANV